MFHHGRPQPASDVYALCATLYALLRGRPPRWQDGHDPTLGSLVDMFAEPVPDLINVPADLTAVLRRGMANEAASRPDAGELRDELAGIYRDPDPTMIMRPVPRPRFPSGRAEAEDETTQVNDPTVPVRRRPD
jgi:hypothetical protein